jgi:hypothetical protein
LNPLLSTEMIRIDDFHSLMAVVARRATIKVDLMHALRGCWPNVTTKKVGQDRPEGPYNDLLAIFDLKYAFGGRNTWHG